MKTLRTAITALFLLACTAAAAQTSVEELREQIRRDKKQLEATDALLGKNRDNIRLSERNVKLLKNNIEIRRKVVSNLDAEAAMIAAEINTNTRQVRELDSRLETLKKEYAEFVYSAWKNYKMNNTLAFLFSSRDFNDATRRIDYMKRYNRMRETKGAEIDSLNYILQYELEKLNARKTELENSKAEKAGELAALSKEENQHASALGSLKKDRTKLEAQAREQQRKLAAAQKKIDQIMAEQSKAAKTGRSQAQIEQDIILSGKFEDNKGKLPWPVGGPGSVLNGFGRHGVSSQQEITKNFMGLNIAAPGGAPVKSVFEGEVTSVFYDDNSYYSVIVRSGDYILAYCNLVRASVKQGDKLTINQEVGRLFNIDDENMHALIFHIWHNGAPIDPEQWLRK